VRALHISTRLAGTDGVSLETAKVAKALEVLGFETAYCAGKLDETGPLHRLVPELHFRDPIAVALGERAFGDGEEDRALERDILERAELLKAKLLEVVDELRPNLLVLQNVWAIPMQLPLAKALAEIVVEKTLPTLSHEHDYPWERERFLACRVPRYLDYYFPFDAATARHLAINSPAQRELKKRRGLTATVVPNVFDFDAPAPGIDEYNADFREAFGLAGKRLFLQPTRVIPRKGIELAIDLLAELGDAENVLVITHRAGDEGMAYLEGV
jgi:mannosylglucosylglycerate synthase